MTKIRCAITEKLDRRGFLRASAIGVSAMSSVLTSCGGLRYARSSMDGADIRIDRRDVDAPGVLVDGPDGELPIFLRVLGPDQFSALSMRCMHRGCQVESVGERFVCPCHGSEYAADGRVLVGPSELPLVEYRVLADDTRIVIHMNAPVARERRA